MADTWRLLKANLPQPAGRFDMEIVSALQDQGTVQELSHQPADIPSGAVQKWQLVNLCQ